MSLCSPYPSANPDGCTPLPDVPVVHINPYLPTARVDAPTPWLLAPDPPDDFVAGLQPRGPEDEWMVAQFLVSRQPGLGGRSIVDHLRAGGDLQPVLDLAADRAARWALAS